MNEYEEVPESFEADTEEFEELYVVAWLLVIQALSRLIQLPPNPSATKMLQLEREVNTEVRAIFSNLSNKAVNIATKQVTEAYKEGVKYSRLALSQTNQSIDVKDIELDKGHTTRLDKMIKQTQEDLLRATGNTENNVKKLVRKVVSKEISGTGYSGKIGKVSHMSKRIENQLRKQFLESGIEDAEKAIIDKAKRRWRLKTYSEMVARTKMNYAYVDAIREESLRDGSDLAIISTKPDTHDACLNYEGMIISLNGVTPGFLTYEQIKATKLCFHPNCGHFVRPVGGLDWIPKKQLEKHEAQMKKYNKDKSSIKQQTSKDSL